MEYRTKKLEEELKNKETQIGADNVVVDNARICCSYGQSERRSEKERTCLIVKANKNGTTNGRQYRNATMIPITVPAARIPFLYVSFSQIFIKKPLMSTSLPGRKYIHFDTSFICISMSGSDPFLF